MPSPNTRGRWVIHPSFCHFKELTQIEIIKLMHWRPSSIYMRVGGLSECRRLFVWKKKKNLLLFQVAMWVTENHRFNGSAHRATIGPIFELAKQIYDGQLWAENSAFSRDAAWAGHFAPTTNAVSILHGWVRTKIKTKEISEIWICVCSVFFFCFTKNISFLENFAIECKIFGAQLHKLKCGEKTFIAATWCVLDGGVSACMCVCAVHLHTVRTNFITILRPAGSRPVGSINSHCT